MYLWICTLASTYLLTIPLRSQALNPRCFSQSLCTNHIAFMYPPTIPPRHWPQPPFHMPQNLWFSTCVSPSIPTFLLTFPLNMFHDSMYLPIIPSRSWPQYPSYIPLKLPINMYLPAILPRSWPKAPHSIPLDLWLIITLCTTLQYHQDSNPSPPYVHLKVPLSIYVLPYITRAMIAQLV